MKTLLIVDDHPIVLEGLGNILRGKGYRIIGATSKDSALEAMRTYPEIDIMVIDVSLSTTYDGLDRWPNFVRSVSMLPP